MRTGKYGQHKIITFTGKEINKQQFRIELELIVDILKAHVGQSNDGNTNLKFFKNLETSRSTTDVGYTEIISGIISVAPGRDRGSTK